MTEKRIIEIMKREVYNISKTGKVPRIGSLPDWLIYLEHNISFKCPFITLTTAAQIKNRMRTFYTQYNYITKQYKNYIDSELFEN